MRGRRTLVGLLATVSVALGLTIPVTALPVARADLPTTMTQAADFAAGRGTVGISVFDRETRQYTDNGANAHRWFGSASVMKMFIAEDLVTRNRAGQVSLPVSDWQLLERMVTQSDDAAASSLYSRYGGASITERVAARYALTEVAPPVNPRYWGLTRITSYAITAFYDGFLRLMDPHDSAYLLALMRSATPTGSDGFGQYFGIPTVMTGEAWGVKQGWMCCFDGQRNLHTTGILGADARYVVVVLTGYSSSLSWQHGADTLNGVLSRLFPGGVLPASAAASNPRGGLDLVVQPTAGTVRVAGWALDPDTPAAPVEVHVYVDGRPVVATTAALYRPDVAVAFPGAGAAHGFDATVDVRDGRHTVCALAINTGRGNQNPLLGCRDLVVTIDPSGSFDTLRNSRLGAATLTGWTIDPDQPASATAVHVYVDGQLATTAVADRPRPDVAAARPGAGEKHGLEIEVPLGPGAHTVCLFAINSGPGVNRLLQCRQITMPSTPLGSLDSATRQDYDTFQLTGWTLDPDAPTTATRVHVYLGSYPGGRLLADVGASGSRPDVSAVYPGSAAERGFTADVTVPPGSHQLCAYAIDTGTGGVNPLIGCRSVTVASGVTGSFDSLAGGVGQARLVAWALDLGAPDRVTRVDVYVDGAGYGSFSAVAIRPDVAAVVPGAGPAHGVDAVLTLTPGSHTVCAFAIPLSSAAPPLLLQCRSAMVR